MGTKCPTCGRVVPKLATTYLCWRCYRNPDLREQKCKRIARGVRNPDHEPTTDEELDALIAEQMDRLPDWWRDECDREYDRPVYTICTD